MKFGCFFNRIKRICKYCEKVSMSPYVFSTKVFRLVRLRPTDLFKEVHMPVGEAAMEPRVSVLLSRAWPFEQCALKSFDWPKDFRKR